MVSALSYGNIAGTVPGSCLHEKVEESNRSSVFDQGTIESAPQRIVVFVDLSEGTLSLLPIMATPYGHPTDLVIGIESDDLVVLPVGPPDLAYSHLDLGHVNPNWWNQPTGDA